MFSFDILFAVEVITLGLLAGTLGGLLGVGGSTIIIPGLTLILGYNQHLYQAAAMIANVAVSIPAAARHRKAGTVCGPILIWILPVALVCVLVGVWLSNLELFRGVQGGLWLGRVLSGFLVYVIFVNIRRLNRRPTASELPVAEPRQTSGDVTVTENLVSGYRARAGFVGVAMGLVAGLLGIGGGAIAVPLQQMVLRLSLA